MPAEGRVQRIINLEKGNTIYTHRGRSTVITKLEGIAKVAKERPSEKFTSLAHLLNEEMLVSCHQELKRGKAVGVDKVTKEEYEANLHENIKDLVSRLKKSTYRPQPVRRVYIPKPGTDKKRPLGIPTYEDKIVQLALSKILSAIYEEEFLNSSFGFRPNRGCHEALKVVNAIIHKRPIEYVVDADIQAFFDHVDHKWMTAFISHRIKDPKIIQLISRFLKAGVMEAGIVQDTPEGTPQGGPISPVLANIYLHYVLDLWFDKKIRRYCKGSTYMVRYADDTLFCFQNQHEAEKFYDEFKERLSKFNLGIAEEKSKIIAFGRNVFSKDLDSSDQKSKPDVFDFLGFTHYCSTSLNGKFRVKRKTSRKKFRTSLLKCKEWISENRHEAKNILMKKLNQKLIGHYRYYGITDNGPNLIKFREEVKRTLFKYMNKRSQRTSYDWKGFQQFLKKYPIVKPKTYVNVFELNENACYFM